MNKELLVKLNPVARMFGGYTTYELDEEELINDFGIFEADILELASYEKSPKVFGIRAEAVKEHPSVDGLYHHIARRRVPEKHPDIAHKTKLGKYDPWQCQYHVHVFEVDGRFELYSHYELRPDFEILEGETLSEALHRLNVHRNPTWDREHRDPETWTYLRGVVDPQIEVL